MTLALTIPYPPSANSLWRAVKGRNILSAEYRLWRKLAEGELMAQRAGRKTIAGPYSLTVIAHRPDNRKRDLGNLEKPISDALVGAGIVEDDCNCVSIGLAWADENVKGGKITLYIQGGAA